MAELAIVLALGSSLAWGLSDFLGGLKSRRLPVLSVLVVSQGAALAVLLLAAVGRGEGPPDSEYIAYAVLAGLAELVGVAALYRGFAVGVMAIVAPVAAAAPVIPIVVGIAVGEAPSAAQYAGIALVVAGIVVISWTRSTGSVLVGAVGASVLFGLLSAAGFGFFYVGLDAASEGDILWALVVARMTTVAVLALALVPLGRPQRVPRPDLIGVATIGLLIIAGDTLYGSATTRGTLGVVAVLSSLYPIVTIALARLYLHEQIGRVQQIGIGVALAGLAAISTG